MPIYRINGLNVLFIHVPKTGGTSVEKFLLGHAEPALHNRGVKLLKPISDGLLSPSLAMQHFHAELLEGMFPKGFFDYAFMVVRHPMQRLVSEYGHSRGLGRIDSRLPFNAWAHMMLTVQKIEPSFSNNHFRPQADFQCFGAEVLHFEDGMPAVLRHVALKLGLPEPETAPHEKRSGSEVKHISPSLVARAARVYARDYESFGYE